MNPPQTGWNARRGKASLDVAFSGEGRVRVGAAEVITVISGGQNGADLGGMMGAKRAGFPHHVVTFPGFMPISGAYPAGLEVRETSPCFSSYPKSLVARTKLNVENSDGTLLFHVSELSKTRGSKLTARHALDHGKPLQVVDLRLDWAAGEFVEAEIDLLAAWIDRRIAKVLNVAGERHCDEETVARIMEQILLKVRQIRAESENHSHEGEAFDKS
jgi:hypothetical protein